MSTSIKYQNDVQKFITEQQANQLDDFSKLFYEDDVIKKKETYYENQLIGGVYYLSPRENVTEVLNNLGANLTWAIRNNKQVVNGYTIWDSKGNDENLQIDPEYSKLVFDSENRLVASVTFDTQTNQSKRAYKVFYFGGMHVPWDDEDMFFAEDAMISFRIDDYGNINRISMNEDIINNESNWENLNEFLIDGAFFIENMMPPDKLYFFTHVEPIVPNF
jgi:hypothetical protein